MNDALSIYILPPALSLLLGGYLAVLALVAFKRGSRKGRVLFALVCLWYSLLSPLFICHHLIDDRSLMMVIDRWVHFFFVYLPLVMTLFLHHLLAIRRPAVLAVMAGLSFLFSLCTQTDRYLSGYYEYSWGLIAKGGVAFPLFGLYGAAATAYAVVIFVRRLRSESHPTLRLRYQYVFYGFGMATVLTFFNIPAMHGIDLYPMGNFSFLPLAILAYGVFKHRLVHIQSLVRAVLIRAVLFALVLAPNLLIFLGGAPLLTKASTVVQFTALMLWYLINSLYVIPIRNLARRWIYKAQTELRRVEAKLVKEMLVLSHADDLIRMVRDAICHALPFDEIKILVWDEPQQALKLPDGSLFRLNGSQVTQLLGRKGLLESPEPNADVNGAPISEMCQQLLTALGAAYAVALEHNGLLIGILAMPAKRDGQSLRTEEAAFIKKVAGTLSLALSNALMYQRIASLKDHLQHQTDALTAEIEERQLAEASLKEAQSDLQEAHLSMEAAVLQANEMTARMEINNHVLTQEMEDRKKIEKALRKSEEMYRLIAENATDVIWTIDLEGRFTFVSPSVRHLLGYTPQEMMALQIPSVLTPQSLEIATRTIAEELEQFGRPGASLTQSRSLELAQVRKDGSTVWTEVNTRFLMDEHRAVVGILGVTRDITQRRRAEQDLIHMAYHDALTGLYNRKAFVEQLEREIRYAERYDTGLGVLFFDLNKFKQVNDTFGHEVGDRLLKEVADRLVKVVRDTDLVARLGGDEFTIILKSPDTVLPEVVARRIARILSEPFELGGFTIDFVSASIGIAAFPKDGRSVGVLMRNADLAMYRAKEGNGGWVFYSECLAQAVGVPSTVADP